MSIDEAIKGGQMLMEGAKAFREGLTRLSTSRAISQAQDDVNSLNNSEMDEMEKRQKLAAVSQNLTLRLSGLGADPQQIAQSAGAIRPAPFADAQDMFIQSQATKSPKLADAAYAVQKFEEDPKLAAIRLQGQNAMAIAKVKASEQDASSFGKEYSKLADDTNPYRARSGVLGDLQKRMNAAGRIQGLYDAYDGNPNKIGMREMATSVANMFSTGSQTANNQINELVPETLRGDANKIAEWWKNAPNGLEQQAFAKQYLDISNREKSIAEDQLKLGDYENISKKAHLEAQNPAQFRQLFRGPLKYEEYQNYMTNGTLLPKTGGASAPAGAGTAPRAQPTLNWKDLL